LKHVKPKGWPITYIFVIPGEPVIEFIVRSADADFVLAALRVQKLEEALSQAGRFHKILGAVRIQYLLDDEGKWEFNYLLTKTGAVIGTEKSYRRRVQRIELLLQALKEKGDLQGSEETTVEACEKMRRRAWVRIASSVQSRLEGPLLP
jgi:hypothetical protein